MEGSSAPVILAVDAGAEHTVSFFSRVCLVRSRSWLPLLVRAGCRLPRQIPRRERAGHTTHGPAAPASRRACPCLAYCLYCVRVPSRDGRRWPCPAAPAPRRHATGWDETHMASGADAVPFPLSDATPSPDCQFHARLIDASDQGRRHSSLLTLGIVPYSYTAPGDLHTSVPAV